MDPKNVATIVKPHTLKLHHLNLLFRLFIRENHTNRLLKTAKLPSQPPSNGLAEVIHGGFGLEKFKLESLRRILYFSSYVKEATYCSHTGRLGGPICGYFYIFGNSGALVRVCSMLSFCILCMLNKRLLDLLSHYYNVLSISVLLTNYNKLFGYTGNN